MTPQEIQALIDAKIAGQGSAVDVGGALPTILSEILELASNQPETHVLEILGTIDEGTQQEALALLKLDGETPTLEQMAQIRINNCIVVYDDIELSIVRLLPGDNGTSLVAGEASSTFATIQVSSDYGTITAEDI